MTGFEPIFPAEEEHDGLLEEHDIVEEEIEGLADIDPSRTDGQHEQDSWRGVAVEDVDDVTGTLAGFLRKRSRKLLGLILRPHVKSLVWAGFLIAIRTLCVLAGPAARGDRRSTPVSRRCSRAEAATRPRSSSSSSPTCASP